MLMTVTDSRVDIAPRRGQIYNIKQTVQYKIRTARHPVFLRASSYIHTTQYMWRWKCADSFEKKAYQFKFKNIEQGHQGSLFPILYGCLMRLIFLG
jgi:hypothetical protein